MRPPELGACSLRTSPLPRGDITSAGATRRRVPERHWQPELARVYLMVINTEEARILPTMSRNAMPLALSHA